ncbi:MAG: hypothetical protein E4H14_20390 [Candidatus Thorarchaeota archaeon]|nr:MAG: hypothetical protein E4H14_20390 [Candidatus Thorarchaeota archaeon]
MHGQLHHSTKIDNLVSITKFRSLFLLKICVVLLALSFVGVPKTLHFTEIRTHLNAIADV